MVKITGVSFWNRRKSFQQVWSVVLPTTSIFSNSMDYMKMSLIEDEEEKPFLGFEEGYSGAHYLQCELPDEVLLMVFSYLLERDLCRLSQVCKRFRPAADDRVLWKRLYRSVFEYDAPLFQPRPWEFEFVKPTDSKYSNPWKESFREMYHGVHVRAGQACRYKKKGRSILHFDTLQQALVHAYAHRSDSSPYPLIFLHSGVYQETLRVINYNLAIIGAAPGDVSAAVIIQGLVRTPLRYDIGADFAYCGYVTIRCQFAPLGSRLANYERYCIHIYGHCKPRIDHCVIRNTTKGGTGVFVQASSPYIRHCDVSDCGDVGIFITGHAKGIYEYNKISRNGRAGIWVREYSNPHVEGNDIHGNRWGIHTTCNSKGLFEGNNLYENKIAGFGVELGAFPRVVNCDIHHGQTHGIIIKKDGLGMFIQNRIHSNHRDGILIPSNSYHTLEQTSRKKECNVFQEKGAVIEHNHIFGNARNGIKICTSSDLVVRGNEIHDNQVRGIYVEQGGKGLIEYNEIYENRLAGIVVTRQSTPIIRQNRIHSGKHVGVGFCDNALGELQDNQISNHIYAGVQIRLGSNPFICGNKIFDGKNTGISILDGGKGKLEGNQIYRNAQAGVLISSQSHPVLRKNKIFDGLATGIEVTCNATATLEYNQIFNNKFGGLCLASGVTVCNNSNEIFKNRDAVEKAVQIGQCLYKIYDNTNPLMHDFYHCKTCSTAEKNSICINCIKTCHAGHEVEYTMRDRFICACGAGNITNQCQLQADNTQDTDALHHSVAPMEDVS